jgi:hypothetical protein
MKAVIIGLILTGLAQACEEEGKGEAWPGEKCDVDEDCHDGLVCVGYETTEGRKERCEPACDSDSDCTVGSRCFDGECRDLTVCSEDWECSSEYPGTVCMVLPEVYDGLSRCQYVCETDTDCPEDGEGLTWTCQSNGVCSWRSG